jgi:antirestriction protein ArdC
MRSLLQQLEAGVEAIQTSEDFKRYLRTAATFHAYSPNNVLLILSQRPDATRVAGYRAWQALGRQVKKGEKAISIFAPRPYRIQGQGGDVTVCKAARLTYDWLPRAPTTGVPPLA